MDRRGFLRIGGAAGAGGLLLAGCGQSRRALPGGDPPPEPPLADESWAAGICDLCDGGCGVLARVVGGKVVKVEGDPAHPVNRGGLCARGQALPQALYDPDRPRGPLRRTGARGTGSWRPASWEEVDAALRAILRTPGRPPGGAVFLTGRLRGHRAAAVDRFLRSLGSGPATIVDPFDEEPTREAWSRLVGLREIPAADLDRCRTLLSVGASFVEWGPSPVAMQRGLAVMRGDRRSGGGRFIQVEPRFSMTAAAADEWIPARPGSEAALLLALAHVLVEERLYDADFIAGRTAGFDPSAWTRMSPEEAAGYTDVHPEVTRRLARDLAAGRPSCVLFGGSAAGQSNAIDAALAAGVVNALLGAVARPGGVSFPFRAALDRMRRFVAPEGWRDAIPADPDLPDRLASGAARAVFVAGVDAAHAMPALRKALADEAAVPLIVSFSPCADDTAALADWVLPDHTALERPQCDVAEAGSPDPAITFTTGAIPPVASSRALVDSLMALAPGGWPWPDEATMIRALAERTDGDVPAAAPTFRFPESGIAFRRPRFEAYPAEAPLVLLPCPSIALGAGLASNLPWMQELADPLTGRRWGSWASINPRDAAALGIEDGDRVDVASERGRILTTAVVSETVMPGTLVALAGQGRAQGGRTAAGRGANVMSILMPVAREGGGIAWGATRVSVRRAREGR